MISSFIRYPSYQRATNRVVVIGALIKTVAINDGPKNYRARIDAHLVKKRIVFNAAMMRTSS
ncbi:hypothetical protein LH22_03445 [Pantoea rwandensis]|uniref:Uncharacterized protein n=1 Tax=Pantoea rwandensis TaxID=1076550 RepID=A0ABM5RF01_9GAMM|nr:hypothetical protein LH22_03445 [Pantoea rwandensis]